MRSSASINGTLQERAAQAYRDYLEENPAWKNAGLFTKFSLLCSGRFTGYGRNFSKVYMDKEIVNQPDHYLVKKIYYDVTAGLGNSELFRQHLRKALIKYLQDNLPAKENDLDILMGKYFKIPDTAIKEEAQRLVRNAVLAATKAHASFTAGQSIMLSGKDMQRPALQSLIMSEIKKTSKISTISADTTEEFVSELHAIKKS